MTTKEEYQLSHTATKIDTVLTNAVLCTEQSLTEAQQEKACANISACTKAEFESTVGDIETALNNIIAIQTQLIGEDSV